MLKFENLGRLDGNHNDRLVEQFIADAESNLNVPIIVKPYHCSTADNNMAYDEPKLNHKSFRDDEFTRAARTRENSQTLDLILILHGR